MERQDSIRFKNKQLFGTTFDAYTTKAMGHVMRLLLAGHVQKDGTVTGGNLSELWSYIYILFVNNKHNSVFTSFSGVRGPLKTKATAKRFIRGVLEQTGTKSINTSSLKIFIENVVSLPEIKNPVSQLVCTGRLSKSIVAPAANGNTMRLSSLKKKMESADDKAKAKIAELEKQLAEAKLAHKSNKEEQLQRELVNAKAQLLTKTNVKAKNDLIDDLIKAGKDKDKELLAAKVALSELRQANSNVKAKDELIDNLTKAKARRDKQLEYVKQKLRKHLHSDSDDIKELLGALKQIAYKAVDDDKIDNSCPKDAKELLETAIISKMCIVKYLADIMSLPTNVAKCHSINLARQKELYDRMPKSAREQYIAMYNLHVNALAAHRDELTLAVKENCDPARLNLLNVELQNIWQDLINIYEDLFGSVRVFVRIRPTIKELDGPDQARFDSRNVTTISMDCAGIAKFPPTEFFGVFGDNFTNSEIYFGNRVFNINGIEGKLKEDKLITDIEPWALYKTFNQLHDGYSIVISGYGVSGAGKSGILLGYQDHPGILHYGLRNLEGVKNLELYHAFELYYDYVSPNDLSMHNKIILLHDQSRTFHDDVGAFGVLKGDVKYEQVYFKQTGINGTTDVQGFIKQITDSCRDNMKVKARIKRTPLNDNSSRSHLFLVFKITFDTGKSGFLSLIDMAGVENAYSIYDNIFNKATTLPYLLHQFDSTGQYKGDMKRNLKTILQTDKLGITNEDMILTKGTIGKLVFNNKAKIEDTLAKNVQILYESFSIVETLQHMKYFFNRRNGIEKTFVPQKMEFGNLQYDTNRVFKSPSLEDITYPGYDKNRASKVTCLMVPLLNYLDSLGKEKLTKFVTFIALRKDKCDENKDALEFGKAISGSGQKPKQE